MKRKIIRTILVLAILGGAAGYYSSTRFGHTNENRLQVSGNIELTEIDISFKVPGKLVELDVDEGAFVKKGQVIARIDRQQVEQQRSKDEAGLAASQAQYDQIETAVRWQQATMESEVALRRAEVRAAQAHLDQLLAGSRPQEIQQASRGGRRHRTARTGQGRRIAQELFKNDDISRAQYDQYRTRLDLTTAVLRQAQSRLALVEEGPRKEDIEAARAEVQRAEAALETSPGEPAGGETARAGRARPSRRHRSRPGAGGHHRNADRRHEVTSPIDGVVLVKSAEIGEVLAAGTTVVAIGDIDHPWLRAYISETDLGRVKLGQPVQLSTDSFPGKTYPGRVSFISSEAEFTPKQIQTKEERVKLVYRIKIDADNPRHELKSNMPVDAEIQLKHSRGNAARPAADGRRRRAGLDAAVPRHRIAVRDDRPGRRAGGDRVLLPQTCTSSSPPARSRPPRPPPPAGCSTRPATATCGSARPRKIPNLHGYPRAVAG